MITKRPKSKINENWTIYPEGEKLYKVINIEKQWENAHCNKSWKKNVQMLNETHLDLCFHEGWSSIKGSTQEKVHVWGSLQESSGARMFHDQAIMSKESAFSKPAQPPFQQK